MLTRKSPVQNDPISREQIKIFLAIVTCRSAATPEDDIASPTFLAGGPMSAEHRLKSKDASAQSFLSGIHPHPQPALSE